MNNWDEITTCRLVALWMGGISLKDIANEYHISEEAVRKKIGRLKRSGVPIPKRKSGIRSGKVLYTIDSMEKEMVIEL